MEKQTLYKIISITACSLVVCFAVAFYAYGVWQEPLVAPPAGNVPAPINQGSSTQYKSGALGVGGAFIGYADSRFNTNLFWGSQKGLLTNDQGASITLGGSGTPYLDFFNDTGSNYDARLVLESDNVLKLEGASLKIVDGTQADKRVLTSDATGKATWQVAAGSPTTWTCENKTFDTGSRQGTLTCTAGYKLISGGCAIYSGTGSSDDLYANYPDGSNGWYCNTSAATRLVRVYVYCCK